jgi:hypothetical protein
MLFKGRLTFLGSMYKIDMLKLDKYNNITTPILSKLNISNHCIQINTNILILPGFISKSIMYMLLF